MVRREWWGGHAISRDRTHGPGEPEKTSTAFSVFFSLPICCLVEAGERGSRWTWEVFTGLGAAVPEVLKAAWITSMASV